MYEREEKKLIRSKSEDSLPLYKNKSIIPKEELNINERQMSKGIRDNIYKDFISEYPNNRDKMVEERKIAKIKKISLEIQKCINENNTNKMKKKVSQKERMEYFNQLSKKDKISKDKLNKLIVERENELNQKCSFQPELLNNSIYNLKRENSNLSFIEKLKEYENIKKIHLDNLKREADSNFPKPKTIKKSPGRILISPSNSNYHRQKRQKLQKIKEEMDNEQGLTFKPKLNDSYNNNLNITGDVSIRNEQFLKQKEENILNQKFTFNVDKECTFIPKINNNFSINTSFQERMDNYSNKYETHKDEIRLKYEKVYTFAPEISSNSYAILRNKKNIINKAKEVNKEYLDIEKEKINYRKKLEEIIKEKVKLLKKENIEERTIEDNNTLINHDSKENPIENKKSYKVNYLKNSNKSFPEDKVIHFANLKLSDDDSLEKIEKKHIYNLKHKNNAKRINKGNSLLNQMDYYEKLNC